jgi:hypothetical protein
MAENENNRSLFPFGQKPCPTSTLNLSNDMPPGLTSMTPLNADPHARGPKTNPYAPESARRPVGEPAEIRPPHNPAPHPNTPAAQVQERNTYGRVPRR